MAFVYLLDLSSLLAPVEPWSPALPPLSWWCAAELAQWTSIRAVKDAWAAAEQSALADDKSGYAGRHGAGAVASAPSVTARCGYTRLGSGSVSEDEEAEKEPGLTPPHPPQRYIRIPFPSQIPIDTRYFSVSLAIVVGAVVPSLSREAVDGTPAPSAPADGTTLAVQLGEVLPSDKNLMAQEAGHYGGVMLAHLHQDPADVPWHLLPRSGCLFHVVLVVLAEPAKATPAVVEDVRLFGSSRHSRCSTAPNLTAHNAPFASSLPGALDTTSHVERMKERWQYFAVENGYECVFHAPLTQTNDMTDGSVERESETPSVLRAPQLELVTAASGRRGLREAPLSGSNRLYQILCNTLWPAAVRSTPRVDNAQAPHGSTGAASGRAGGSSSEAAPHITKRGGNGILVVGTDEDAMWDLFRRCHHRDAPVTRPQQRFSTAVATCECPVTSVAPTAATGVPVTEATSKQEEGARRHRTSAVVLVNRYYAAVVRPRLLQTAFFDARMEDVLSRYWEKQFRDIPGGNVVDHLCADAPVLVLWPPASIFHHRRSSLTNEGTVSRDDAEASPADTRALYPSLETVLDSLARRGCPDVVVVVLTAAAEQDATCPMQGGSAGDLTRYEAQICEERHVEVLHLALQSGDGPLSGEGAAFEAIGDVGAIPVLKDEDDTAATRGVDRLQERLHCVRWDLVYHLNDASHRSTPEAATQSNSCLLQAIGESAFEEEAWICEVLRGLLLAPPRASSDSVAEADVPFLCSAAPTVAAMLLLSGKEKRGSDTRGTDLSSTAAVEVSNSYFEARILLHFCGGLWSYYSALAAPPFPAPVAAAEPISSDSFDHDAYVVVTSLRTLLNAVRQYSSLNAADAGAAYSRSRALSRVIRTLARRQAEEWLARAKVCDAAGPCDPVGAVPSTAADSPLVMLYITDVAVSDVARVARAERCVKALAYNLTALEAEEAGVPCGVEGDNGDEVLQGPLIELVFESDVQHSAEPAEECPHQKGGASVEGVARVREAFEQHLWPHRQRPSRGRTDSAPLSSDENGRLTVHSAVPTAAPITSCYHRAGEADSSLRASSDRSPVKEDHCVAAPTRTSLSVPSSCRVRSPATAVWELSSIGCALPPGFLVDPECLRSVRVPAVEDVMRRAVGKRKDGGEPSGGGHDVPSPAAAPATAYSGVSVMSSPDSLQRHHDELLRWMEKMKQCGERLGEELRKEQAAVLALAMQEVL